MNTLPDTSPSQASPSKSCQCPPPTSGGSKSKRNFFIDITTAVVFSSMVSTGILLAWILPPGRFGGHGLTWLGLDRHGWGDIHLWLAVVLLGLVVTHVLMHWSWVRACWQRCLGSWRSIRTWGVVAVLAVLILLPVLVPVSRDAPGRGQGRGWGRGLHAATERANLSNAPEATRGRGWGRGDGRRFRARATAPATNGGQGDLLGPGAELWDGDF